jgi:hypothetical protein
MLASRWPGGPSDADRRPGRRGRRGHVRTGRLDAVIAAGDEHLPWALETLQIGRELERAADHAVDIAEQAWFLVTGELRELA